MMREESNTGIQGSGETQNTLTVREFVESLSQMGRCDLFEKAFSADALRAAGIDMDAEKMRRLDAALMLHKYLLEVAGIPDLEDISAAAVLKDLYDCRKCVAHIAQVYLRGLMTAVRYPLPDGNELLVFDGSAPYMREQLKQLLCSWSRVIKTGADA